MGFPYLCSVYTRHRVRKKWDKNGTKLRQKWDKIGMNSTVFCATLVSPPRAVLPPLSVLPFPLPSRHSPCHLPQRGKVMECFLPSPAPKTFPHSGPSRAQQSGSAGEKEEQGSGARATSGSPSKSGLCDKTGPQQSPAKRVCWGEGGARERRKGDQRKPEQKRTLRRLKRPYSHRRRPAWPGWRCQCP